MPKQLMVGAIKYEQLSDGSWQLTHPSGVVVKVPVATLEARVRQLAKGKLEVDRAIQKYEEQRVAIAALSPVSAQEVNDV